LFGGFAFLLANMLYATYHGKPSVAPLLSISTIFNPTAKPMVMPVNPADVFAGLVLLTPLSMTFEVLLWRGYRDLPADRVPVVRQPPRPEPAVRAVDTSRRLRAAPGPVLLRAGPPSPRAADE